MIYCVTDARAALKAVMVAILPSSRHHHNKAMATNNLLLSRDHTAVEEEEEEDGSRLLKVKDLGLRRLEGQLMEGDQASLGPDSE